MTATIETFPATMMNCFTGSLVELNAVAGGPPLSESDLLARGDGYLFRSGCDEWGFPEHTFPVEDVGLRGMGRSGATMYAEPIAGDEWRPQVAALLRSHGAVVVWTNSAHLSYAPVYASSPGYLHAVLVTDLSDDLEDVQIYDSLVVDRTRYACRARMPAATFARAIRDRVRTETYDHMGAFHVLESVAPKGPSTSACIEDDLRRQVTAFWSDRRHREAVDEYRRMCISCFQESDERARRAARRLFDHIKVLYVLPGLDLFCRTLDGMPSAAERCRALIDHWEVLALLALKFEATLSPMVLSRLEDRFQIIDEVNAALWDDLRSGLGSGTTTTIASNHEVEIG